MPSARGWEASSCFGGARDEPLEGVEDGGGGDRGRYGFGFAAGGPVGEVAVGSVDLFDVRVGDEGFDLCSDAGDLSEEPFDDVLRIGEGDRPVRAGVGGALVALDFVDHDGPDVSSSTPSLPTARSRALRMPWMRARRRSNAVAVGIIMTMLVDG